MAPSQTPAAATAQQQLTDDERQEQELEEALKQLKLMHIKLRGMRLTIPTMVQPIFSEAPPEVVFAAFKKSVQRAQREVKEFSELYQGEKSVKVLAMAAKSEKEKPDGIKQWNPCNDPDWMTLDE